ncbi:hypothetical protein LWC35_02965 [Pseudonocardia kujensis]|nr:hypothetical protein [Pseudonocardia kujensis]MCE0761879.1 hypothetical protein [Pseudonocardia kujensis]
MDQIDRIDFSTSDPDEAAAVIRDSYRVTGGVRISGDTDGFAFSQNIRSTADFAVTRFQCSVTVDYAGPLGGLLCVEQIHAGRLSFRTAGAELLTVAGDICLVPPHTPWRATSEEIDLAPLTLDRDRVADHAAGVSGIIPEALRFTSLEPVSPASARYWAATVAHVREEVLGNPAAAAEPLVDEAFRTLATGMLTVFPQHGAGSPARPARTRMGVGRARRAAQGAGVHRRQRPAPDRADRHRHRRPDRPARAAATVPPALRAQSPGAPAPCPARPGPHRPADGRPHPR